MSRQVPERREGPSDSVTKSEVRNGLVSSIFDAKKMDAIDASWKDTLPQDRRDKYLIQVVRGHGQRLGLELERVAELVEPGHDLRPPLGAHAVALHGLEVVGPRPTSPPAAGTRVNDFAAFEKVGPGATGPSLGAGGSIGRVWAGRARRGARSRLSPLSGEAS